MLWRAGRVGGSAALGQGPHWSITGLIGTLRLAGDDVAGPLLTSVLWASIGASVTLALAWPLAWVSRRSGAWQWVVAATVALALATPGPVAGMALVVAYVPFAPIYDTWAFVVLAYVLRTLP